MSRTKYFSAELTVFKWDITQVDMKTRTFIDSKTQVIGRDLTEQDVMNEHTFGTFNCVSAQRAGNTKGIYRMTDNTFYSIAHKDAKRPRDRKQRYITRTVQVNTYTILVADTETRTFITDTITVEGNSLKEYEIIKLYNAEHVNKALQIENTETQELIYWLTEEEFYINSEYVGETR